MRKWLAGASFTAPSSSLSILAEGPGFGLSMADRPGGDSSQQVCLNAPIADSRAGLRRSSGGNLTADACPASSGACVREGDQVTTMSWDAQGEAQAALRTIVADPRYGPAALSNAQTMTNLLKDMLPDAPRESSVLVAASDVGVPGMLQSNLSQGMDVGTASRLAAGSFENKTALTPDACTWAVGALASALRLEAAARPAPPPASVQETVRPLNDQPTRTAMAWRPPPAPSPWPGSAPAPRVSPGRPNGLRLAAAALAVVGAILIIWACALPDLHIPAGNGRDTFSIFNSGGAGDLWFAVEPVGVAVFAVAAALVLVFANRSARLRLLAIGVLFGFGIQTILLFAGYEYYVRSPNHAGSGPVVGILGAIVLLVAGLIAAVSRPAAAVATPGP